MPVSIYIIILNYNGKQDTVECLRSLRTVAQPDFKIILIDNGSEEILCEEPAGIVADDPRVVLIRNEENLGFAGGNNVGIRYALDHGADYILLLNNDTVVSPDFLQELLAAFKPGVGIAGPKILYYDQPERIWSEGSLINWIFYHGRSGKFQKNRSAATELREVDSVTGCALMIRREVIECIGLMDESFFLYGEEDDWCYRAGKAGYRIVVNPRSVIWHKVSQSSGGDYNRTIAYYKTRNKILFIRKHLPFKFWLPAFGWLAASLLYRCVQALLHGRVEIVTAIRNALTWHIHHQVPRSSRSPEEYNGC